MHIGYKMVVLLHNTLD